MSKPRFTLHECRPPAPDPGRHDMMWSVLIVAGFAGLSLAWIILR